MKVKTKLLSYQEMEQALIDDKSLSTGQFSSIYPEFAKYHEGKEYYRFQYRQCKDWKAIDVFAYDDYKRSLYI